MGFTTITAAPMTDQQFADFCAEHPSLCFETTASLRSHCGRR
jgi:hypothetical protein